MLKRIVAVSIIIAAILAAAAAAFIFSRPAVAFLSADLPAGFASLRPSSLTLSFRLAGNADKADLVLVMPSENVPDTDSQTVLFGREADGDESPDLVVIPDDVLMWSLALGSGTECILYDSSSQFAAELAEELLGLDDNAYAVTYSGRVSVANYDQVISGVSGADVILALTPSSSMRILRSAGIPPAITDSLHAAALDSTGISASVGVDWNATVEALLAGSEAPCYALIPSEQ